jgi:hypothetical protein
MVATHVTNTDEKSRKTSQYGSGSQIGAPLNENISNLLTGDEGKGNPEMNSIRVSKLELSLENSLDKARDDMMEFEEEGAATKETGRTGNEKEIILVTESDDQTTLLPSG